MTIRRISPRRAKTAKLRYNSTFGAGKVSKPKRKPTGQAKVFREIWEARYHRCEVCCTGIAEATASNFSHLLPKGSYPGLRLDPRNIIIKCERCHELWHQHGPEGLRYSHNWMPIVARYDELKQEYNQRTRRA